MCFYCCTFRWNFSIENHQKCQTSKDLPLFRLVTTISGTSNISTLCISSLNLSERFDIQAWADFSIVISPNEMKLFIKFKFIKSEIRHHQSEWEKSTFINYCIKQIKKIELIKKYQNAARFIFIIRWIHKKCCHPLIIFCRLFFLFFPLLKTYFYRCRYLLFSIAASSLW